MNKPPAVNDRPSIVLYIIYIMGFCVDLFSRAIVWQEKHSCLQLLVDRQFSCCMEVVEKRAKALEIKIEWPAPSSGYDTDLEIRFVEKEEGNRKPPLIGLVVAPGESKLQALGAYLKVMPNGSIRRLCLPRLNVESEAEVQHVHSTFLHFAQIEVLEMHGFVHPDVYRCMLDALIKLGKKAIVPGSSQPALLQEVKFFVRPIFDLTTRESLKDIGARFETIVQQVYAFLVLRRPWRLRVAEIKFEDAELQESLEKLRWLGERDHDVPDR